MNKWLAKCEWIIDSFKIVGRRIWQLAMLHIQTIQLIRVGFMISVAVGSVMRYYRVFPREDIKQMIYKGS